jgi:hypothetical protein
MAKNVDEWNSLWRASAHEAVPYTEDFPECLLVLPELVDGAVAQGAATQITIRIELAEVSKLIVSDNGEGITSERRLLTWASPKNAEGTASVHHRYGHGSKKCLTKWCPDYNSAVWKLQYRRKDKRGVQGSLNVITGPFRGRDDTPAMEDENDIETLSPSGTRWTCDFDPVILGARFSTVAALFEAIKEILRTRYSERFFAQTDFIVEVTDSTELKRESSKECDWKTIQQTLDAACNAREARLLYDETVPFNDGVMTFKYYQITADGRASYALREQFPIMGQKNMRCSRIHISLNGRSIEARPVYKFLGREGNHNDLNGLYGFVNFEAVDNKIEQLPTPCTTKVSFYENCENFKLFLEKIGEILKKPYLPVAKPQIPVPPPAVAPLQDGSQQATVVAFLGGRQQVNIELAAQETYNDFFARIRPIIKIENPSFTTQQITTEIARRWKSGNYIVVPDAAAAPAAAAPAAAAPEPAPMITHVVKCKVVGKNVVIYENNKVICRMPTHGIEDEWNELFDAMIDSKGSDFVKKWCLQASKIKVV